MPPAFDERAHVSSSSSMTHAGVWTKPDFIMMLRHLHSLTTVDSIIDHND
jgi:hypothetical protein